MSQVTKLNRENIFSAPLNDVPIYTLAHRNLPHFIDKLVRTYFKSHYPQDCIVAGLDVTYTPNNNILEVNVSEGVVIADEIITNISKSNKLSINVFEYPSNTIYTVNFYQYWDENNKFYTPELQITPIINDELIINKNIDTRKGFLILSAVEVEHNNTIITSVTDRSNLPININNQQFTINRYSYHSTNTGSGGTPPSTTVDLNIEVEIIKVTSSILSNKSITTTKSFNPDLLNATKLYILDSTKTLISPLLIYKTHYNIILPRTITWNNYELQNLLSLNEFIQVEYYYSI